MVLIELAFKTNKGYPGLKDTSVELYNFSTCDQLHPDT